MNHRSILETILATSGVDEEKQLAVLVALDKYDNIGIGGLAQEIEKIGITSESWKEFVKPIHQFTNIELELSVSQSNEIHPELNSRMLNFIANFVGYGSAQQPEIAQIDCLYRLLLSNGSANRVLLDPTLARGLSYYTGTIMEVVLTRGDFKGSIGGGGRYDGLIGMFGKEQIPACGFSLGLERILVVMEERNMFPPEIAESTPADVMVTIWNEETIGESLKLANELRAQNIRVTVYPEPDKLGKQIKYADSIHVPFVCVLGESEIAENKVTLKNMKTGEQSLIKAIDIKQIILNSQQ